MNSPFLIQVKEFQGDGLSFITPSENRTKNVKFDGKDYPNEGPGARRGASSSIQRVDERTLVITDKSDGQGDGYRKDWALSRSEGLDDHGARSRPRQADCDGVRAKVGPSQDFLLLPGLEFLPDAGDCAGLLG